MNNEVFEEMQGAAGGAKAKLEKQARQLAYDTKYKVKQALAAKSGGNADPATVSKMYMAQLAKSPAPPAVKALAKKKLLGEEYVDVREFAVESVTNALLKVFVEKKEEVVEEVIEEEEKRTKDGEKKFHIKVTDKKTGNSYHRYATRAKIAELRANPNIASVEMSHYGEGETNKARKDYDGDGKVESSSKEHAGVVHNAIQRAKGGTPDGKDTRKEEVEITEKKHEETNIGGGNLKKLAAKAAKRIDADVDGDVDTDDPKSTEMGEFVPSPDGKKKIKTKIQREDFLSDWRDELFEGKKKNEDGEEVIDVMKGKNKITVSPTLGEKMNLAKADMGDVVKDFQKSDAPQFKGKSKKKRQQMAIAAKLEAERGGKKLGEEHGQVRYCPKCDKDETRDECAYGPKYWDENSQPAKEEDPRGMKTKANLVRNKLRAMGLKMSYEPESNLVEQEEEEKKTKEQKEQEEKEKRTVKNIRKIDAKKEKLNREKYALQRKGELPLNAGYEAEGEQLDERQDARNHPGIDTYLGADERVKTLGRLVRSGQRATLDNIHRDEIKQSDEEGLRSMEREVQQGLTRPGGFVDNIRRSQRLNNSFEAEGEIVEERKPEVEKEGQKVADLERRNTAKGIVDRFRAAHPGSRQEKKKRGAKKSVGDQHADQRVFRNKLQSKYGRTKKQQREAEIMSKHTSPRD